MKYKHFRGTIDELLHLEHYGRPLEDYSPDEIAAMKKELDKRYADVSEEPTAQQIERRMEFFRKLRGSERGGLVGDVEIEELQINDTFPLKAQNE